MDADFYIREAKLEDFEAIRKFLTTGRPNFIGPGRRRFCDRETFFRHFATYRLLAFESEESCTVVAYAEFRNFPYIWALPSDYWLEFLRFHYCLDFELSYTNSLFFNYCTVAQEKNPILIKSVLREVFFRENQLKYIMIIEPPDQILLGLEKDERLNYFMFENISKIYYPRCFSIVNCRNTQKLHVIDRNDIIPRMNYRQALPEDNDDIIEVIDVDRPDMREEFGDYFIAEDLLRPGIQHNLLIVTEVHNVTAGFVWVNDNVDVLLLLENYEVDMFPNLIKYCPKERYKVISLNVVSLEKKPTMKLFTSDAINKVCTEEFIGKSFLNDDLSSLTLSSQHNLRVHSLSGMITTSNEHYWLREDFFLKIQKLQDRLVENSYYSYRFLKNVYLCFNIPDVPEKEVDNFLPDHNSNIFALQLFGMHKNNDIRRLYRVILAAFAAYPNRDYCVFSLPLGTPMTKNLKFVLQYFVRIAPRPRCQLQDELYITHRSSIYGEISLHNVRYEDIPDMEKIMLYNLPHMYDQTIHEHRSDILTKNIGSRLSYSEWEADIVHKIIEEIFNNDFSEYVVKTIRCGRADQPVDKNILVGFVVLRPFRNVHLLKTHYVQPKRYFENFDCGEIITMRLHPFFHHQVGTIFRELARFTDFSEFYYIQVLRGNAISLPNDVLLCMQPLEPKPYKKISKACKSFDPEDGAPGYDEFYPRANYVTDYFAVYYHNLKPLELCGSDRPLVIVGFTPLCKAFLRTLIFNWNFSGSTISGSHCCVPSLKVVVIAPPGVVEAEYDNDVSCEMCKDLGNVCYVDRSNWNDFISDVTLRLDVRKYVHFVSGNIRRIDREDRQVVLMNDCQVYYETLLLLNDTSFGFPKPMGIREKLPPNYIQINNRFDRIIAFHKINLIREDLKSLPDKSIIVYGAHLRCYEFIEFLLKHGVEPKQITLIIPRQKGIHLAQKIYNQPMADDRLEVILEEMLRDLGVKALINLTFSHWISYTDDKNISKVVFDHANGGQLTFDCDLFCCFYEVYIDMKFVEVLRNAEIKMNYRNILVDDDYRTNDPAIYAMGNYIEHLVEPNYQYKFVSLKEAAEKLAYKLGLFPAQLQRPYRAKYSSPHSCETRLPLGYTCFKVVVPKRFIINTLDNEFSRCLITFDDSFCRVRLNQYSIAEEMVFVTRRKMSFQFLLHFVGHHEAMLNNLRGRWCHEEITCFIEFFQQPWTELIMHEDFHSLHEENMQLIYPLARECIDLNIERSERYNEFKTRAHAKRFNKKMESFVLAFLEKNRSDFYHPIALPDDFPKPK